MITRLVDAFVAPWDDYWFYVWDLVSVSALPGKCWSTVSSLAADSCIVDPHRQPAPPLVDSTPLLHIFRTFQHCQLLFLSLPLPSTFRNLLLGWQSWLRRARSLTSIMVVTEPMHWFVSLWLWAMFSDVKIALTLFFGVVASSIRRFADGRFACWRFIRWCIDDFILLFLLKNGLKLFIQAFFEGWLTLELVLIISVIF